MLIRQESVHTGDPDVEDYEIALIDELLAASTGSDPGAHEPLILELQAYSKREIMRSRARHSRDQ